MCTHGLQDGLAAKLAGKEVPRKLKDTPFVQIPLGVTEDRLVGTVDIEASIKVKHNTTVPYAAKHSGA